MPEQRILEASVRLTSGGAVTGWVGCRLSGAAYFDGVMPDRRTWRPVPLALGPAGNIRGDGSVTLSRDRLEPEEVVVRLGIPCAEERRSLFDDMRCRRDLREAVVAMDMMAAAGLVSIRRMRGYLAEHRGWRGAPMVAQALELASEQSRSPNETRLRLVWLLDAGLPPPLVNQPVFDLHGRLLAVPYLLDVQAGLVGEFDGADHRGATRHSKDVGREDLLRRHGLEIFRVTGPDLPHTMRIVDRMTAARRRALWQPAGERLWTTEPPAHWEAAMSLDDILDHRDLMRELHFEQGRSGRGG